MSFQWNAGVPLDEERIARMQAHFLRPSKPPPVAWFNSEVQEYHTPIISKQPDELSDKELEPFFRDVTSGTSSFGVMEEWEEWFLYLLPPLLVGMREERWSLRWFEASISAFMNMHWAGIEERYAGFREDVLLTLGTYLMDETCWTTQDLDINVQVSSLSAAVFLYLKYLTPSELQDWLDSVLAITGSYWQACFAEWSDRFRRFYNRAIKEEGSFRLYTWMEPSRVDWEN